MNRPLSDRVDALETALQSGIGGLSPELRAEGEALVARARQRLLLAGDVTVVALAGATGSGKSSLFNAIAGETLAQVGTLRPTTSAAQAAIRTSDGAVHQLLDWLAVDRRAVLPALGRGGTDLVLLDLPDHDSVVDTHRATAERLYERVDLLVWVVDPQKYADAVLHERYLRPLSALSKVMVLALNHADRLSQPDLDTCVRDLRHLLTTDGLAGVPVIPTSAKTGVGVDILLARLSKAAAARRASGDRLKAEVVALADRVIAECGPQSANQNAPVDDLVESFAAAAGVPTVVQAVAKSTLHRTRIATGWPPLSWLGRFKVDPLRRLHIVVAEPSLTPSVTSLPEVSPAARAHASQAVRTYLDRTGADLPDEWVISLRAQVSTEGLADDLDRAIGSVSLIPPNPWWWRVLTTLQWIGLIALFGGFLWLAGIGVTERFLIIDIGIPVWRGLPWPTWMFFGGVVLGLLLGGFGEIGARVDSVRQAAKAKHQLNDAVREVALRRVVDPVADGLNQRNVARASARKARD